MLGWLYEVQYRSMRYMFTYLCGQTLVKSLLRLTIWRANELFKLILKIHVPFMYFLDWFWSWSAGWKRGGKKWWDMRIGLKQRAESYSSGVSRCFAEWNVRDWFHSQNDRAHRCYLTPMESSRHGCPSEGLGCQPSHLCPVLHFAYSVF